MQEMMGADGVSSWCWLGKGLGVAEFIPWTIPRVARGRRFTRPMLSIMVMGPGGGGGAGMTGIAGTVRCGGGGGAAGNIASVLQDPEFLPDTLFIRVFGGGAGGVAPSGNGSAGQATSVLVAPAVTTQNIVVTVNGGNGGVGGTAVGIGTGGTAGAAVNASSQHYNYMAWTTKPAASGANSGAITGAAGVAFAAGGPSQCGGAGGGSMAADDLDYAGGAVTFVRPGSGDTLTRLGGVAPGGAGNDGLYEKLIWALGGAGGATSSTGTAGAGGRGMYGCGGGGGGGGITGGAGGNGGPGLVWIRTVG